MKDYSDNSKLITPWGYFWYNVLFCIPFVGFLCLVIFSLQKKNMNLRNYARSFFVAFIVAIVMSIVLIILALVLGFMVDEPFVEYEEFILNAMNNI